MRHISIFLALILSFVSVANAQQASDEDLILEQAQLRTIQGADGRPAAGLIGNGTFGGLILSGINPYSGTALVSQTGELNSAIISQQGQGNIAALQQIGSANTTVFEQIGNHNSIIALLEGNQNYLSVLQRGNQNRYEFEFKGDHLDHSIEQHGDGLSATQTGIARRPFSIEQRGHGASISIEHNR